MPLLKPFILFAAVLYFGLVGCVPKPQPQIERPLFKSAYTQIQAEEAGSAESISPATASVLPTEGKDHKDITPVPDFLVADKTLPDVGSSLTSAAPVAPVWDHGDEGNVQLNLENISPYDFINLILGEILKVNYSISPKVAKSTDKISLNMSEEMTPDEFYRFSLTVLAQYGIFIDKTAEGYFVKKGKRPSQSDKIGDIYFGKHLPVLADDQRLIAVVPVDYLSPGSIPLLVRPFLPPKNSFKFIKLNNFDAFGLSGTYAEVTQILNLLQILDRPYISDKKISLLTFSYLPVKEFIVDIKEILSGLGIPVNSKTTPGGIVLLPLEPLNALLVVSPKESWLKTVAFWLEKYDNIDALGDTPRLFVYTAKNRAAAELLEVLDSLIKGNQAVSPRQIAGQPQANPPATKKKKPATAVGSSEGIGRIIGQVLISIDSGRNALVIQAKPAEYKNIEAILIKLDTPPRQVLAEVTVAEVTLTDQFEFGIEWFLRHEGSKYGGALSTTDGLGVGGSGLNFILAKLNGDFLATLNASAGDNLINIISTPHVTVLDGKTATINVGTDVPIVTSESSEEDLNGSILRNIQYRNTGVNLTVTPIINSDSMVTMTINQSLSEAQTNSTSSIDSPIILNRSISTVLSLKSGETVLLGGLISQNTSSTTTTVPFLGDIPGVGVLFRSDSEGHRKTELVVQITPYILKNSQELDALSEAFRDLTLYEVE